jgi:hypothetical protein
MTFQSLSGLFGGVMLILDPSGNSLNMPLSLLNDSPFNDYLIPGLILFLILGLVPFVVLNGLWKKKSWSWYGSLFVSLALIIWIAVEVLMIGYQAEPPLQLIYGLAGILILIFTLIPSVKKNLIVDN